MFSIQNRVFPLLVIVIIGSVSGLLDTFPSSTRQISVLDLDEITVFKIIPVMNTVYICSEYY
ncbi:hypothetical protein OUZ56_033264 [Daphnia magna]|uniref:Uncharacterized protein n=1 Tax=Daphnia magna TaxID=35525 RepID=A0ABQ9ZXK7_9CRUS|nr:hypothetical protein OUZ56_033264 [Daphnia magna]